MRTTVSIEYLQINLTLYLPNSTINRRLAEDCLKSFQTSYNQARQVVYSEAASTSACTLRWSSAQYLSILYKVWGWTSTWSRRLEKLNKTDVHMYTARYWRTWVFPHHPMFYLRLSDWDCCWLSNSSPPATRSSVHIHYLLLPLISSVLRKLDARITVSSVKHLCYTMPPHYIVSWPSS